MLLKITEKCSMGCSHCMSDCKPEEKHMDLETFKKSLDFYTDICEEICFMYGRYNFLADGTYPQLLISGGEPLEHPKFKELMTEMSHTFKSPMLLNRVIVTTNGEYLAKHPIEIEFYKKLLPGLTFQVVIDDRYYPVHVNEEELKKHSNVMVCHNVDYIYPLGRAVTNQIPYYKRKGSACFNIRAIAKQLDTKEFHRIIAMLSMNGKYCTPAIEYDGSLKLGESQLCPPCSHIDKSFEEIYEDIVAFKCHGCDILNDKLPEEYRKFIK